SSEANLVRCCVAYCSRHEASDHVGKEGGDANTAGQEGCCFSTAAETARVRGEPEAPIPCYHSCRAAPAIGAERCELTDANIQLRDVNQKLRDENLRLRSMAGELAAGLRWLEDYVLGGPQQQAVVDHVNAAVIAWRGSLSTQFLA
ncbi:unnamed protein product, partial [Effrenium voratum]